MYRFVLTKPLQFRACNSLSPTKMAQWSLETVKVGDTQRDLMSKSVVKGACGYPVLRVLYIAYSGAACLCWRLSMDDPSFKACLTIPNQVVDSRPMDPRGMFEPFSKALEFHRQALSQFQVFDKCKNSGEVTWRTLKWIDGTEMN